MHKKYRNYKKLLQKYISLATLQKMAVLKSNLNGRFFYTLTEEQCFHIETKYYVITWDYHFYVQ